MPDMTDTDDFDAQDTAETFDEEATDRLATDRGGDVLDVTSALGDADLEGDDDALDAAEESDSDLEEIGEISIQQEADDLDGDNSDDDPLAVDDIPDFSSDRDFADAPGEERVSARPAGDVETISMGDVDALGGIQGERTSDLEAENLSDSDLVELDYKEG